ncbi:TMV resistance protein N, partial [Mucuna pruriens]
MESPQNDAEVVEAIVDLLLSKLAEPLVNLKGLVGINEKIADVESLIRKCKDSKDICLVGIYGMGGIGKTTLAEIIFYKLQSGYEGSYFLANEREQSSKRGIISLKNEIFSSLLGDVKINTQRSLPNDIVRRIGRMKVLIVLDDVNDSDHLQALLGTLYNFGSGSRIIVTTRDERVLNANKADEIYRLTELSFNEALQLFKLIAFHQSDHQREYDVLSKRMVHYAKGVPLCQRLHRKVNVSNLKSLLKDGESDNSVVAVLERLKDKALISFYEDNFICMHDSLQEMGLEIVRQQSSKHPGSGSWLWDPDDICEALKNDKGTEAIRSIQIDLTKLKELKFSPQIFAKMSRLQFLEIYSVFNLYNSLAEEGLCSLETELRFFCWYSYSLKSLPAKFSVEKLVILRLPFSRMEKLWDGVKNLVNLKELDLNSSPMLKELPDLSKATNLEVLILWGCSLLIGLHPSIFSLAKLKKLDVWNCQSLTTVARYYYHLRGNRYLTHDDCKNLWEFSQMSKNTNADPRSFGNLLHVTGSDLKMLPSWLNNLTQLLHLEVSYCTKLQTIPELPQLLKTLCVRKCNSLESLPELPLSLETLTVQQCTLLKTLSELPPSLKYLAAPYCESLQTLPELPQLIETLNVKHCKSLQTLPELPQFIRALNVQHCKLLQTLPELPSSLQTLQVQYCESLQTLPELPQFISALNVEHCKLFQTLPELPSSLQSLEAQYCELLQTLPKLPQFIRDLNVKHCKSLQTLPELPLYLRTLNLQWCTSLQTLPKLPLFLKALDVQWCTSLQTLPKLPLMLETLVTQEDKSLTTILFPSTTVEQLKENRIWVVFWNCLNLDEHSLAAIGLNAQINVMKFANQHHLQNYYGYSSFYDDCYFDNHHLYQAVYVYPGSSFPEWLEHMTTNDYINIDLSSAPPSPLSFIFCFILGKYQNEETVKKFEFNITKSDGDRWGKKDSMLMLMNGWDKKDCSGCLIESDHLCVMYDQRCSAFLNSRAKNQTKLQIQVTIRVVTSNHTYPPPEQILKGFGVSPVSTSEYNRFIQQMELARA